jgi:hypothetical protein
MFASFLFNFFSLASWICVIWVGFHQTDRFRWLQQRTNVEGEGPKFHLFFIKYAFGVLYKPMVIVTDGQLLEAGKPTQTNAHFFGLCCQLILTTIFLIICLLCPLPIRLVGKRVF